MIHVRWNDIPAADRIALEQRFRLTEGTPIGGDDWAYVPGDTSTETLRAIVAHPSAADTDGTRNYMGVRSGAIDAVIAALLQARGREEFVSTVRTLDRILISGFYVVPLFHLPEQWIARSNAIEHPATTPLFGYLPETWWRAP